MTTLVAALAVLTTAFAAAGEPSLPDNGLARTPPMGFNDWNAFGCAVSQQLIEQTADRLLSTGLAAKGYRYVNIDDCWMTMSRSGSGHLVPDPVKFPGGIAAIAHYVHARGLKLGIYADAGTQTCAGYPGSLGHEVTDARDFATWGVDLLKYDNCFDGGDGSRADYLDRYAAMGAALAGSGRRIVYSICEWGVHDPAQWAGRLAAMWRTTADIADTWASIKSIIAENVPLAGAARPGRWNDPDMLEVGNGAMTDTEYRTHFAMWAMMAAPLLIGTDLRTASARTLAILGNSRLIAVDQDPLGRQAEVVAQVGAMMVLSKPLANGDVAVALYNPTDSAVTMSTTAAQAGLAVSGSYSLLDAWTGTRSTTAGAITATVPAHGTVVYRVAPSG